MQMASDDHRRRLVDRLAWPSTTTHIPSWELVLGLIGRRGATG